MLKYTLMLGILGIAASAVAVVCKVAKYTSASATDCPELGVACWTTTYTPAPGYCELDYLPQGYYSRKNWYDSGTATINIKSYEGTCVTPDLGITCSLDTLVYQSSAEMTTCDWVTAICY